MNNNEQKENFDEINPKINSIHASVITVGIIAFILLFMNIFLIMNQNKQFKAINMMQNEMHELQDSIEIMNNDKRYKTFGEEYYID